MLKVKIQDKEYGFQFGTGAFEICCDNLGVDIHELQIQILNGNSKALNSLAFAAIQNWCELQSPEVSVDFTYRQYQLWLDEADHATGLAIVDAYKKSMYEGKTMQERYDEVIAAANGVEEEQPKKKSRSRKS